MRGSQLLSLSPLGFFKNHFTEDRICGLNEGRRIAFLNVENRGDFVDLSIRQFFDRSETMSNQDLALLFFKGVDAEQFCTRLIIKFLMAAFRVNIDSPTRQLSGQTNILAPTADGLGKLIIRNDQLHAVGMVVNVHPCHRRWCNGMHNKQSGVWVEGNDINRFTTQLCNHSLHS